MNRAPVRLVAIVVAFSLGTGCAARGDLRPGGIPVSLPDEHSRLMPQPVKRPDTQLGGGSDVPQTPKGKLFKVRRLFLKSVTPLAVAFSTLIAAPVNALQQLEGQTSRSRCCVSTIPSWCGSRSSMCGIVAAVSKHGGIGAELLDAIPSMDGPGRARADALLMWMTSLCLLSERLGV